MNLKPKIKFVGKTAKKINPEWLAKELGANKKLNEKQIRKRGIRRSPF
jgi:hypothetical protein